MTSSACDAGVSTPRRRAGAPGREACSSSLRCSARSLATESASLRETPVAAGYAANVRGRRVNDRSNPQIGMLLSGDSRFAVAYAGTNDVG